MCRHHSLGSSGLDYLGKNLSPSKPCPLLQAVSAPIAIALDILVVALALHAKFFAKLPNEIAIGLALLASKVVVDVDHEKVGQNCTVFHPIVEQEHRVLAPAYSQCQTVEFLEFFYNRRVYHK